MLKMLYGGAPTWRWIVTRIELRLADLSVLAAVWLLSQSNQSTFGGSMDAAGGIPMGTASSAFGLALVIAGRIWIRRIARGNPEPEANDQFWRSRA